MLGWGTSVISDAGEGVFTYDHILNLTVSRGIEESRISLDSEYQHRLYYHRGNTLGY